MRCQAIAFAVVMMTTAGCGGQDTGKEQVGALMFKDKNLSSPPGNSCADCHSPVVAFRDPESDHSTSGGALAGIYGSRNAPTAMYAGYVPALHHDQARGWIGGLTWDGRSNSLEEQAEIPLLNPIEMNNPNKAAVVAAVRHSNYAAQFRDAFGANSLDDVEVGFAHIAEAFAAYERSTTFEPFSSKYDRYLAGQTALTDSEQRGLALFEDPSRGNCASCHPSRPSADGTPPLFTDFSYGNLGIPRYQNSLFFKQVKNRDYVDHGLMATVGDAAQDGKFRVPTLRNIARSGPFGHNGYFENLPYMIDFLNTRDRGSADPAVGAWAPPEVPATVDHEHVGNLGLSGQDVDDVVAFLGTLTDAQATAR